MKCVHTEKYATMQRAVRAKQSKNCLWSDRHYIDSTNGMLVM